MNKLAKIFYKKSQEETTIPQLIPEDKKQLFLSHLAKIVNYSTDLHDGIKKIDSTNLELIRFIDAIKSIAIQIENISKSNIVPGNMNDLLTALNLNFKSLYDKANKEWDLIKLLKDSVYYVSNALNASTPAEGM